MKALNCPMILVGCSTRVDRSLSLRFSTPELVASEKTAFMELQGVNLNVLLQPMDGVPDKLVEVKGEFDEKRPSERLRAVLFVLHKQKTLKHQISIPFDDFYKDNMNRMIQSVKDQLEPATF